MSIVIAILAGVFGFLFLRGLINHVQYLLLWRKVRRHVTNMEGPEEDKQQFLAELRDYVQSQDGIKLP